MQYRKIITAGVLLSASNYAVGQDLDGAADGFCACSAPMLAVFKDAVSGGKADMAAIQADMEKLAPSMEACFGDLEKKYPDIAANEELRQKVETLAQERCPRPQF